MEEDNRTSASLGEYVVIEHTPKQQTVCVVWCGVGVCVCLCMGKMSARDFRGHMHWCLNTSATAYS